ncbi:MAG TPA: tRNA modification GTPase [Kofleriaceae bacterium]|nr:tRNA modification GTPase [Kofleriaceae bacterium]
MSEPGDETIAAIATPAGSGGVGIVRVSGPRALDILSRVIGEVALAERRLTRAVARDPVSGERVDEVLAVVMRGPRSYTGEDVAELHGHGGALNMGRLLRAVLAAGARAAGPGEFTRRAFAAGRMDLTQVEAVLAVIEASSERGLRLAQAQLGGGLGEVARALRGRATELLADLEASVDFPEEGLAFAGREELAERAAALAAECRALAGTFAAGRALREGVVVALVGAVNAGKSSLFNRLVGAERALVAVEPGTTRDYVEAEVVWDGVRVTLVDTAGRRAAESEVERRGIELGARRAAEADLEVALVPAGGALEGGSARRLEIISKGDEQPAAAPRGALVTSARTGAGIPELVAEIVARVTAGARDEGDGAVVTSERQRALLEEVAAALDGARADRPEDVAALDVRAALVALSRLLGDEVGDAVLDALFARFCIGK